MFCFLECEMNAEVNPGLFPVTEIEFKVDTDILGKVIGSTKDESTGKEPIATVCFCLDTGCLGFRILQIHTSTKTDTGIYFPFGNYHVKTIGGSHFEVKHIAVVGIFYTVLITIPTIPHITDLTTNGESTFPNAGQGIIVGNINTYSV